MSNLTRAIILATQFHDGQTDKGGNPYILHPLRLMLRASTEDERIVALLHDTVEDTPLTLDDLRNEGFSDQVVEAVNCLTRRPEETYEQFINRIQYNGLARRVKIFDLEDNTDLSRIKSPSEKDRERLKKYNAALTYLREVEQSRRDRSITNPDD